MQQLEMWHSLYEKGAVGEEYKKVQENVLSDIKQFLKHLILFALF